MQMYEKGVIWQIVPQKKKKIKTTFFYIKKVCTFAPPKKVV